MIALGGVVEDDVEDDFEPGRVKALDHGLELGDLTSAPAGQNLRRIAGVRREEAERVVAPVVVEPSGPQKTLVDVLVDREQLDGGDAQPRKVVDRRLRRQARISAAQLGRHVGMALSETLDVGLVDDRVGIVNRRWGVAAPVEFVGDYQAPRHVSRRVEAAWAIRRIRRVAQDGVAPVNAAVDGACVWIEQQLHGVAAEPLDGRVWSGDAVAVPLAGSDARNEAVPDPGILLQQRHLHFAAGCVEEA